MTLRNVLITGANRGIGLELCKQLSSLPSVNRVIATCRYPHYDTELNRLLGFYPKMRLIKLNTTDYLYYDKVLDDCHQIVGTKGINVLINNAGIAYTDTLTTVTAHQMMDNIETNAVAPLMLTKKLLPLLKMAVENGDNTTVVNMSSVMGLLSQKIADNWQYYPYRTSKAALNMVTKILAHDLAKLSINVVALHPGWVKTRMGTEAALMEPDFSAQSCIKVIQSVTLDRNKTGVFLNYDGKVMDW